jgi:hypothetical protein
MHPPVTAHLLGRLTRGFVVLGEELLVVLFGQYAQDLHRIVRIVVVDRLRGHDQQPTAARWRLLLRRLPLQRIRIFGSAPCRCADVRARSVRSLQSASTVSTLC